MGTETRNCQNCKKEFVNEPDLIAFCERINVPLPTFCIDCSHQQRSMFRNERALYKRKTSAGKDVISVYSADKQLNVMEQKDWWGDGWDPMSYGKDYDLSRPFFAQFKELMKEFPVPAIINWNAVNSEYCTSTTDNKNCYLVFGGDFNENCSYGYLNFYSKDSMDLYWVNKVELAYDCIDTDNSFRVAFCQKTYDSTDSMFLYDCVNCNHCFGCVGLRNKSYCIWNEQKTKEDYEKEIAGIDLGSFSVLKEVGEKFEALKLKFPKKYADINKSTNCTGNYIFGGKNAKNCFESYDGIENCGNLLLSLSKIKDSYNSDHVGYGSELVYNGHIIFSQSHRVFFSALAPTCQDVEYCYNVSTCTNCFGCTGLRNKSYCILNKQYTKEEYEELLPKIKEHMMAMPYVDKMNRTFRYGDFFPYDLSYFAYNESKAQEFFPLTKEEALAAGFEWHDSEEKGYKIDIEAEDLPDNIKEVSDDILSKNIGCEHKGLCSEQCSTAFRIIPGELELYRRLNIPLPRSCSNCRHYRRMNKKPPFKLWHRKCECNGKGSEKGYANQAAHQHGEAHCGNEFESPYSPEKADTIYCEACYQSEVV